MIEKDFQPLIPKNGLMLDLSEDKFPTKVYGFGWGNGDVAGNYQMMVPVDGSAFVYIYDGPAILNMGELEGEYRLQSGMYALVTKDFMAMYGTGIVIVKRQDRGMFTLGGPVEKAGRLRYIDGCTDSLLIPPWLKGMACLNYLHFPACIAQTRHTHPSNRIGMVIRGRGRCKTPDDSNPGQDVIHPLEAGMVFNIPTGGRHSFFTDGQGEDFMDVIAWHPDSDFGPEHDEHPMINRTIVDGKSAKELQGIQTTKDQAAKQ